MVVVSPAHVGVSSSPVVGRAPPANVPVALPLLSAREEGCQNPRCLPTDAVAFFPIGGAGTCDLGERKQGD